MMPSSELQSLQRAAAAVLVQQRRLSPEAKCGVLIGHQLEGGHLVQGMQGLGYAIREDIPAGGDANTAEVQPVRSVPSSCMLGRAHSAMSGDQLTGRWGQGCEHRSCGAAADRAERGLLGLWATRQQLGSAFVFVPGGTACARECKALPAAKHVRDIKPLASQPAAAKGHCTSLAAAP